MHTCLHRRENMPVAIGICDKSDTYVSVQYFDSP